MSADDQHPKPVLRPGRIANLGALLELQESSPGAPRWSPAIWTDLLYERSNRAVFVMDLADVLVGFIVLSVAADVAELESVVVSGPHRGCGLGRALCMRGIAWAEAAGASDLRLEVRPSNVAAIGLYQLCGFREQGRRKQYYHSPVEDALLMALALQSSENRDVATV